MQAAVKLPGSACPCNTIIYLVQLKWNQSFDSCVFITNEHLTIQHFDKQQISRARERIKQRVGFAVAESCDFVEFWLIKLPHEMQINAEEKLPSNTPF